MVALQLIVHVSSFLSVFPFFHAKHFQYIFTSDMVPKLFHNLPFFLLVHFTYEHSSQVSMSRIMTTAPSSVSLTWNTSRIILCVIRNSCASNKFTFKLYPIIAVTKSPGYVLVRNFSPSRSLCNRFFFNLITEFYIYLCLDWSVTYTGSMKGERGKGIYVIKPSHCQAP